MPLASALEIPPGTWGSGILQHTVEASDDAAIIAVRLLNWPPLAPVVQQDPATGPAVRSLTPPIYTVSHYLVSFDTSFVTNRRSVVAASLRLIPSSVVESEGMVVHNDHYSWDSPAITAYYDSDSQPGDDGAVLLADIDVGQSAEFICRPGKVVRDGMTQYRLTIAGGQPTQQNNVQFQSLVGLYPPRLVLLTTPHVGLWEMW